MHTARRKQPLPRFQIILQQFCLPGIAYGLQYTGCRTPQQKRRSQQPAISGGVALCRGSVLELEGKSYLCFGGAESQDKDDREPGVNWWKQEMPSDEEYDTCRRNLEAVDYKVDYVLTHDAPSRFLDFTALALGESNRLHLFLDEILLKLTYEKWFFGCYHKDVQLSTKSRCVFCDVIPMGERRTGLFRR